ncbi:unnamed protein product [Rotaria magnacalcarata]|uniref:VWA7 N-terminal domain-containing protein n=5 Tax=Rotaria magnacalcarata TaxID=392030 RepID=A0A819WP31_9BILA|nr:unnamed protein product [Rotaria magnacalcarata]CAF4127808.1 unnamed protein product [Rotaria magnacalcarata]
MKSNTYIQFSFYLLLNLAGTYAFIPHPLVADVSLSSNSITHTEITQLAVIRSLARFFFDTRLFANDTNATFVNEEAYFTAEHTIDDLYELAHPEYNAFELISCSLPLKFIVDSMITENALVDFDYSTRKVAAAHYDNEAFINASRRILQFRERIINNINNISQDLSNARDLLGQLLHTLQDFYSHSNWIEMGKTDINKFIGFNETIGIVARPDQPACTNNGCTKIEQSCTLWQEITVGICPLVYYDCQNNILPEINNQQILTSGYYATDVNENNELLQKPTNVGKCSHGSVLDKSSHIPAIGGINKDSYSLVYSPHANIHKQAADLAVKATEQFLNDLRRDIGDHNFDRLFVINPSGEECQLASNSVSQGKRFRFFTPGLSTHVKDDGLWLTKLKRWFKKLVRTIKSMWISTLFGVEDINKPTYDLSVKGVNVVDVNNSRAAPYIFGQEKLRRKKRMIHLARKR